MDMPTHVQAFIWSIEAKLLIFSNMFGQTRRLKFDLDVATLIWNLKKWQKVQQNT